MGNASEWDNGRKSRKYVCVGVCHEHREQRDHNGLQNLWQVGQAL